MQVSDREHNAQIEKLNKIVFEESWKVFSVVTIIILALIVLIVMCKRFNIR